jgi:hypothetical protein
MKIAPGSFGKLVLLALSGLACASASLAAQDPPKKEVIYVEPTDTDYVGMILAATAWAKGNVAKSLGVLQRDEAAPAWRRGIAAAAKEYGLKTIEINDFTMVCFTRQATRSTPMSRECSMKGAEAVLQFNGLRIAGDTGTMVTSVTRVPKNASRTETTHFCFTLDRGTEHWSVLRSEPIADPDKCIK